MQIQTHDEDTPTAQRSVEVEPEQAETRAHLRRVTPAIDIFESEDELLLRADLPGVSADAVELRVERGTLALTATRGERGVVYRRAFALPDTVDAGAVDAELVRGVLTVHLRKREDQRPRRIEVRTTT